MVGPETWIQQLEHERGSVARALREDTAQVLGSVLLHFTMERESGPRQRDGADVDAIREAVRTELSRILEIASGLSRPRKGRGKRD